MSSQSDRQAYEHQRAAILAQLKIKQSQLDALTVKAPFDGQVIAPMIHELSGKYLQQGEEIATVVRFDPLVVRASLTQSEAGLLFMNEPVGNPFPGLRDLYNATGENVADQLFKQKVEFTEDPPAVKRETGDHVRQIIVPRTNLMAGQEGQVVLDFEYNRITKVTGTFKSPGAFDAIVADTTQKIGPPEAQGSTSQPAPAGQRKLHWVAEHDEAALDVDLVERPGEGTTLTYRILGRKVDVRLAGLRSENLQARVLTRIPAASPHVAHASMTHLGGGDQQNDPHDQTGTKVQTPVFEVRLRLENPDEQYKAGQRAYVRFTMEKDRPLLWQWVRKFRQLVQTQSSNSKWL